MKFRPGLLYFLCMGAKSTGIQRIDETPRGFIVVHAGGTELLKPGTPAHAAMEKLQVLAVYARSQAIAAQPVDSAETSVPEVEAHSGAAGQADAKAQAVKGPGSIIGRLVGRFAGQKAPPRGITVVSGPKPGQGQRPSAPPVLAAPRSGLARALAARQSGPLPAETGPLRLHDWELMSGPKGLYARGTVYGFEHFPDGCVVETPYLGMYSRETNSFALNNSRETVRLGQVKPGEEAAQSLLLQKACAFEKPRPPEYKKPPPDLCLEGIQIKWNRAQFRLSDKSTISSQLNHPLGLAFRILAEDMARQKAQIDWGLPKVMEAVLRNIHSSEPAAPAAAGGPPEVLDDARPDDEKVDLHTGAPKSVAVGKPTDVSPGKAPKNAFGEIEQMYAPADGGADSHKIAVKTGQGTQIASIPPEVFARVEPIVRTGLCKRVALDVDFPDGKNPRFQFKALVDRDDKILASEAIDALRTNALEQLAKIAAQPSRSAEVQPGGATAPVPGEIRVPQFRDLTLPAKNDPPTPEMDV